MISSFKRRLQVEKYLKRIIPGYIKVIYLRVYIAVRILIVGLLFNCFFNTEGILFCHEK